MSAFPGSPRLLKGAIVGVSVINPLSSVVIFQYNPDTLTRTIRVSAASREGDKTEALRLKGPPDETVRLDVEIDATDQLEQGDEAAQQLGVYPALSRLELLLYPSSTTVIANEILAAAGVIEVVAPEAPLTLLVWGPKRVLPVRMNGFTIAEEAFDPSLNPIRAKVSLDLTRPQLRRPRARQRRRSAVHGPPDREGGDGEAGPAGRPRGCRDDDPRNRRLT